MKNNKNIKHIFSLEMKNLHKPIFVFLMLFSSIILPAQEKDKQQEKEQKEAQELLSEASLEMNNDNFPLAEADYRKAIALDPKDDTGKYNLGNAYYNKNKNAEAMERFKQAASVAESKAEKHKAFHNLGNSFMNEKKHKEAVEAYKNALRNNPNDDETRYNLALAKKMLEEQEKKGGGGDDNKEDKKDNKDKKDDKGDNKEGDKGDEKENKDQGDQKDQNKEGDKEKEKGQPNKPKDEKGGDKPEQQQQVPGKLSPQQVKNLLEAMGNEEKKVQDKINATKQKGAKVKSSKDW